MTSTANIHEASWVVEQLHQRLPEWIAQMGYPEVNCQLLNNRDYPAGSVFNHPEHGIVLSLNIYYFRYLDIDEMKAIVAHELGHIADDQNIDQRTYEQRHSLNYYGELLDAHDIPIKARIKRHVFLTMGTVYLASVMTLGVFSLAAAAIFTVAFLASVRMISPRIITHVYMHNMYSPLHEAEYTADAFAVAHAGRRKTVSALRAVDKLSPYRLRWRHSRSHPSLFSRCRRIYLGW